MRRDTIERYLGILFTTIATIFSPPFLRRHYCCIATPRSAYPNYHKTEDEAPHLHIKASETNEKLLHSSSRDGITTTIQNDIKTCDTAPGIVLLFRKSKCNKQVWPHNGVRTPVQGAHCVTQDHPELRRTTGGTSKCVWTLDITFGAPMALVTTDWCSVLTINYIIKSKRDIKRTDLFWYRLAFPSEHIGINSSSEVTVKYLLVLWDPLATIDLNRSPPRRRQYLTWCSENDGKLQRNYRDEV